MFGLLLFKELDLYAQTLVQLVKKLTYIVSCFHTQEILQYITSSFLAPTNPLSYWFEIFQRTVRFVFSSRPISLKSQQKKKKKNGFLSFLHF